LKLHEPADEGALDGFLRQRPFGAEERQHVVTALAGAKSTFTASLQPSPPPCFVSDFLVKSFAIRAGTFLIVVSPRRAILLLFSPARTFATGFDSVRCLPL